ncbi:hypothetical protein J2X13_000129 [Aminobacter aminovorans]|nr:hypothetical protein [Aminobacter aminovorans]
MCLNFLTLPLMPALPLIRLPAPSPRKDGEKGQCGDAGASLSPSFTGRG